MADEGWSRLNAKPTGFKYPMFKDPGPKNHPLNGFWDGTGVLKYWVLGPSGKSKKARYCKPQPSFGDVAVGMGLGRFMTTACTQVC